MVNEPKKFMVLVVQRRFSSAVGIPKGLVGHSSADLVAKRSTEQKSSDDPHIAE